MLFMRYLCSKWPDALQPLTLHSKDQKQSVQSQDEAMWEQDPVSKEPWRQDQALESESLQRLIKD